MNYIFLSRIWKIEGIQTVKTVPCSLFPTLTDNFFSKPYLIDTKKTLKNTKIVHYLSSLKKSKMSLHKLNGKFS